MRAVKGSLGHSPKERHRGLEYPRPGSWHVEGNKRTPDRMLKKDAQQGRRRVETGGVPSGVR